MREGETEMQIDKKGEAEYKRRERKNKRERGGVRNIKIIYRKH